jgi:hypothetical protein
MRKPVSLSAAIVLLAAGFAVASIATGGSLAAVAHAWTTLTGTTPTVTATTTGTTGGRGVEICVRFRRGHHRFGTRTIVVSFHELHFRLRHGSHLGPCVIVRRHHGRHGFGDDSRNVTTTTTVATTTVATTTTTVGHTGPSGFVGKGTTGRHGDDGDDNGNGRGDSRGNGNGGGWNNFAPSFGHRGGHRH